MKVDHAGQPARPIEDREHHDPVALHQSHRVSGKLVACDEGQELVIEKAAKI